MHAMVFVYPTFVLGLAAVTTAFLIPTSISSGDRDVIDAIPFEAKSDAHSQILNLECLGCPIAVQPPSGAAKLNGVYNQLQFKFAVAQNEEVLLLNGLEIYPSAEVLGEPLTALQITAGASADNTSSHVRLGYDLAVTPITNSLQDQLEFIAIHLQILEIGGRFVDGLESVELTLIKTPGGKLRIGNLHAAPVTLGDKKCDAIICKMRTILREKILSLKTRSGCQSKAKLSKSTPYSGQPHNYGGHSRHHTVYPHRKPKGLSRLLHNLKSISLHVLMPVFIGITAGFAASLTGMFVGQAIVFLWRTFYRRDQNGRYHKIDHNSISNVEKYPIKVKSIIEHPSSPLLYADILEDDKDDRLARNKGLGL